MCNTGCLEDLDLASGCHEHEAVVRREGESCHWGLEVEVSNDNALWEVDDKCKPININCDEGLAIWREPYKINI